MNVRVLTVWLGLWCLGLLQAGDGAGRSMRQWQAAVVTLEVTRTAYDFAQPWSRRAQTVLKSGLVVGPRELLASAADFPNATQIRVQKGGRGQWFAAKTLWVDYPANLALLTVEDAAFWRGLKPVRLANRIPRETPLRIVRWRGGNFDSRQAEFSRFLVNNPNIGEAAHVMLQVDSEIDGAGWGEPVVMDGQLAGLVYAQVGNSCQVLPTMFIASVLEARRQGRYRGLGYFDFTWQPTENPETLRYLKVPGEGRGVVVIHVPDREGVTPVLRARDVLLEVDGFAIDNEGDYQDPVCGHLMLENLSTRGRWAGERLPLKIWREGREMQLDYTLPRLEDAARLVPEAPYESAPEYLIAGGLIFQPLTRNYLRTWGQDWERSAPFRLAYFRNEEPTQERPSLVVLSAVLPDLYNLGYQELRTLVVEKVNGRRVSDLAALETALRSPTGGYHVLEFLKGETLQRLVLDAQGLEAATRRVLERYGIEQAKEIRPR